MHTHPPIRRRPGPPALHRGRAAAPNFLGRRIVHGPLEPARKNALRRPQLQRALAQGPRVTTGGKTVW